MATSKHDDLHFLQFDMELDIPEGDEVFIGGPFSVEQIEKEHILQVLDANNWSRKKALVVLGINQTTLYRKLKKWGLSNGKS